MPYPKELALKKGKFRLSKDFTLAIRGNVDQRIYAGATRFLRRLDGQIGVFLPQGYITKSNNVTEGNVVLTAQRAGKVELHEDEAYQLQIDEKSIRLNASNDIGLLRGLETLLQLVSVDAEGYYFPAIEINDAPRFPWRGLMIDVARHFQPIEVIKRNLDGMAAVKMNVLHLHLTDDQGFRIESKNYPKLHELGSDGFYFTQEEIKEIVRYAGARGIRVVPEFDLPGHATSWLVPYPELGSKNQKYEIERFAGIFDPTMDPTIDKTYEMLDGLFKEITPLFPDKYFHIGGDENEGKHWDENDKIQAFMKANNMEDNHQLQAYFNERVQKMLVKYDKKMIGWDEIMHPDLSTSAVIQSWRGPEALTQAAKKGYQTLLSNGYYIDLMFPAKDHYAIDPLPNPEALTEEERKNILGGEATMWSELVTPMTIDSRIWPRTAAIAERFWSPSKVKDVDDMYERLAVVSQQLEWVGLQHMSAQNVILRNIAHGQDISSLETLVKVVEPLKRYTRNPGGTMYKSFSPFTLFADAAKADAPDAKAFNQLVDQYLDKQNAEDEQKILNYLTRWNNNHEQFLALLKKAPVLKEIEQLSENLSLISAIGKEAISLLKSGEKPSLSWYQNSLKIVRGARAQGGRTELQVVSSIERLLKSACAQIPAQYVAKKVKVDGELAEWDLALWDYFVPTYHENWKDTCFYAVTWDEKNLYLAFKVQNRNLQAQKKKRDEVNLHQDDGIEFLLDTRLDKSSDWENDDIAYHVNVFNAIIDDKGMGDDGNYNNKWNGNAKTAVKLLGTVNQTEDKDNGYQVEVAVSWKELGIKPKESKRLGINLCVNDRDDRTQEYRYYDYMNLKVFHLPSGFAELLLVK